MNIFLVHPDPTDSAKAFFAVDPIRARKQLLECCQILACVDHLLLGSTQMKKADGSFYKKAHPHHPITKRCAEQFEQYRLCYTVAAALSALLPAHACSKAFIDWYRISVASGLLSRDDPRLLVCRKRTTPTLVNSREEYAEIMGAYLSAKRQNDRIKI